MLYGNLCQAHESLSCHEVQEVPVGAVAVAADGTTVLAVAHNLTHTQQVSSAGGAGACVESVCVITAVLLYECTVHGSLCGAYGGHGAETWLLFFPFTWCLRACQ